MKVHFFWIDRWNDGYLFPEARSYDAPNTFKGLIFSFLNDDEGHGIKCLSNWIDEGLIEIEKISNGELNYYDMWAFHAWGAEITKANVLIYWGYDDTKYDENMSFECFYRIIKEWGAFLKIVPSLDQIVEFEC